MSIKSVSSGNRSMSMLAGQTPEHHVLIAETTVGAGGAASVTFSNIPADYQHLQIRARYQIPSNAAGGIAAFNGDTTFSNYRSHRLGGDGASAFSDTLQSSQWTGVYSLYATTQSSVSIIDILDYANTSKNKTTRTLHGVDVNGSGGYVFLSSGLWMSTSAITSILLRFESVSGSYSFTQHSTFQLYGVK